MTALDEYHWYDWFGIAAQKMGRQFGCLIWAIGWPLAELLERLLDR